jgi:hypothetical protein
VSLFEADEGSRSGSDVRDRVLDMQGDHDVLLIPGRSVSPARTSVARDTIRGPSHPELVAAQPSAVTIEAAAPAERAAVFAKAFGLSARETALPSHLVAGRPTREIMILMFLSEYTVQDT